MMRPADLRNCDDLPFVGASTSRGNGEFLPNDQRARIVIIVQVIPQDPERSRGPTQKYHATSPGCSALERGAD
jgi:hypothetical protein